MKKVTLVVLAAFLCALTALSQNDFYFIKNGESNGVIGISPDAGRVEKFAATELYRFIRDMTGVELKPVQVLTKPRHYPPAILLGRHFAEKRFADDIKFLTGSDGFAVRKQGKNIFIFGAEPKGTLNGVYDFLEKNSDIIWARPRPYGTIFTESPEFKISNCNYRDKPVFDFRGWGFCWTYSYPSELWMTRNRCNYYGSVTDRVINRRLDMGSIIQRLPGHNLGSMVPNKKYFKTNPDFYCMHDGKRREGDVWGTQLCFTNKTLPAVFAKEVINRLNKLNPPLKSSDFINISVEDNSGVCDCPGCLKPLKLDDGTIIKPTDEAFRSTQYFLFLNDVVKQVRRQYPNAKFMTLGYLFAAIPPKCNIHPAINISYCPFVKNDKFPIDSEANRKWTKRTAEWFKATPNIILREYYGCAGEYPRQLSDIAAKDLRQLSKLGCKSVQSEWVPDIGKLVGAAGSKQNLRWSWDASCMEYWVITRLSWNPFQDPEALRDYFCKRAFRKAAKPMRRFYSLLNKAWYSDASFSSYTDSAIKNAHHYIIEKGIEKECTKALTEAMTKAEDTRVKQFISDIRQRYNDLIKQAKATKIATVKVPFVTEAAKAKFHFGGVVWNKAATIDDFKAYGKPNIPPHNRTQVKVMYDHSNLYFGFEFSHPDTTNLKGLPANSPRDKWPGGDMCEIFLDGNKPVVGGYYHFVFDFRGNRYDATGYDKKWNGNWRVKTEVKKDCWKALVTIPWATIGLTPKSGDKLKAILYRGSPKGEDSWLGMKVHQIIGGGNLILEK